MTSIPKTCDVAIVGGGPAGSMSACFLARMGYDVVIFEKQQHPRPTVGENLIPHFWKYTDMVGLSEKIEKENFVRKVGGTVVWENTIRQIAFKDFGYPRPAFHVERDRFDQMIFEHAKECGAQAFENVSVLDVDLDEDKTERVLSYRKQDGETGEITTRYVVDATGQSSLIARKLGLRKMDDAFRFMSMWAHFKDSYFVAYDGHAHPFEKLGEIHPTTFVTSISEMEDRGWSWHIPLKEVTSVGFVMPVEYLRKRKSDGLKGQELLLELAYKTPILKDLLKEATIVEGTFNQIRDYSYQATKVAGPGWFAIGDASGFVDPIFSVGVVAGMYSAYSASWAIDRCLKKPHKEAHHQALYTSQLKGRIEVARSLALPCYRPEARGGEMSKRIFQFERSMEQELMYVVSVLTTRSGNLEDLAGEGQVLPSDKFREIPEIVF